MQDHKKIASEATVLDTSPAPGLEEENRRLRQEVKELRLSQRVSDEYLSVVTHELSTPLTAIKAYIEQSDELKLVYPNLRPGNLWRENQIIVPRGMQSRDPSIVALGVGSQFLGSRLDWVVGDDIF